MSQPPLAIEIDQLVRRYGRTDAVNGLSLNVPQGRCYGFFGRNGAGKTTTIKCPGLVIGIASVLSFAGANHRTDDRSRARVLRQCAWLAALVLMVLIASIVTQALMLEWRFRALP